MLEQPSYDVQGPRPYFDPEAFDVEDPENSMHRLLAALTHYEDTLDGVDWSRMMDRLVEKGSLKVDAFVHVRDHLESRIAFLQRREKEFQAARKSAESGLNTLMSKIKHALEANGFSEFKGNEYRVYIKSSNYCSIEEDNVDCSTGHRIHYGEFIRTKYEWDKEILTAALKLPEDHPLREKARKIASIRQNTKAVFEVIRERGEKRK